MEFVSFVKDWMFESRSFPFFGPSWVAMFLVVGVEVGEKGRVDGVHLHQLPLLPPGVLQLPRLKEAGEGGVWEAEGGGGGHDRHRWVRRVSHSLQMFLYFLLF